MEINKIANEVHAPFKNVKDFRKVRSYYINNIWSIDLVEMIPFENENNGYKYILNCIDIYSRYVWTRALKNKTGAETTKAFESIIKEAKNHPEYIWSD